MSEIDLVTWAGMFVLSLSGVAIYLELKAS